MLLSLGKICSLSILDWGFTKDKNHVYCDDDIVQGTDPKTFEVLGRKYSRDKRRVFYLRSEIVNADRDSFVADPADPNKASDNNSQYVRGVP
jgi:hypothetical protein